ncbi:Rne/Rng family ribonuclease [Francisella tularensis]|uniref:Ribonuclease E n=2 Tax=Francisella tularensis subsp. holarctica TaxID=119857 RepID=A0AAI8BJN5_FRATH|nr:Rne/Rng family ribonuclease [Francisella tularensis]AHH46205.1 ribonuclease E [Francisella tularensis subsp. holarctica PHIT-FT049]EBA52341.1 ribonuclease E [Francisella tularensis subsp. holarctica 257]ABI82666.1 ribonuclease E [Francisella tularensis subsp. holarctica OSU18]AFT92594.1 ribonuclease E [Francisella tularensis subsp. holarctica FSC200]AJI51080.1 ribonuclease, Rne/Rng family domain protein [Francisella tularensis subsp. holarctica]
MKRILINSKSGEETRIATLDNGKLIDLDIESVDREQKKANIYKGYISRIEPSLNAIFVNYGEEKNGFLPFKEVSEYYLKDVPNGENIAPLLSEGQELIVQIDKEERGDKGAALTTFITLAGSYMVLLPNNPEGGGISRRVEGEDRERLKKYLKELNIPKNMSVIARTACVECSFEELKHDFDTLVELWGSISQAYHRIKKPALLHKESDIIVRTVRDHLKEDVKEIIVDSKECFEDVKRQLILLRQSFDINKVKLYNEELPLFAQFGIDQQIENAYKREIRLPSGGSIVIDTTEALVAIDVNSSRANKAEDVETTAFKTNLEAAEEVARQLRIRDLGGLVIVDFIDMSFYPNRKQVEEKLMEALQQDRARIQMSRISKLGLVEISRQRLSSSINESVMQKCPRCEGHGFIKTTQATALTILRKIRAEAIKEDTNEIRVQVPVDIAAYILNEKRDSIVEIERISQVKVMIIPNFNMESPKFQMQRIWGTSYKSNRTSSELIEDVYNIEIPKAGKKKIAAVDLNQAIENQAASNTQEQKPQTDAQVDIVTQNDKKQDDVTQQAKKKGFFARLFSGIFATDSKAAQQANNSAQKQQNKEQNFQRQQQHNKAQKDNNQRNERNNSNNKNERNKNKSNNDKFDKKSNNRNSRSNNLNLNNAEEVIDITQLKYQNQTAIAKTDNIKKVISKNPDEFISVMVKDVLENYDSLKDNGATKIATQEKIKTNKYLKFDTVSVDTEIALLNEVAKSNQTVGVEQITAETEESLSIVDKVDDITIPEVVVEQEKPAKVVKETNQTSEAKPKKEKQTTTKNNKKEKPAEKEMKQNQAKPEYINYSPAIDFESQALI